MARLTKIVVKQNRLIQAVLVGNISVLFFFLLRKIVFLKFFSLKKEFYLSYLRHLQDKFYTFNHKDFMKIRRLDEN